MEENHCSSDGLFAILEIYRTESKEEYLKLARRISENILRNHYHDGWFLRHPNSRFVRFDNTYALALLTMEAIERDKIDGFPDYLPSRGYIHGRFDGHGRTYDSRAIWSQRLPDS